MTRCTICFYNIDMEVGMCEASLQRKLVFANCMEATNVMANTEFALQILCQKTGNTDVAMHKAEICAYISTSSLRCKLALANRMEATNVISNTEFALQILCQKTVTTIFCNRQKFSDLYIFYVIAYTKIGYVKFFNVAFRVGYADARYTFTDDYVSHFRKSLQKCF